jgi:hypothetical protein
VRITPEPTDDEVAAIVAAIEAATPRGGAAATRESSPRWRWSGRWWTRPVPQRRVRPW